MDRKYRFIGKPTPRKDGIDLVTGKTKFIKDVKLPDMLHGKALRSPYPHAIIKSIETAKARALPGVKAVLTYEDVPPTWKAGAPPPHIGVLNKKVRFVGDAVAWIAAETEEKAIEAMALITVEYEQLPAVYDVEEAMKPGAPQLYDEFPGNVLPRGFPLWGPEALQELVMGDVHKGFGEADIVTEGTYTYENLPNPIPPESPGAIALWEEPDKLTIWTGFQNPHLAKCLFELWTGLTKIRTLGSQCGASYGSKGVIWQVALPAALLSKATGRPVKVCFTKEEHLSTYVVRLGSRIHGKIGMKRDGTVTAMSGEWLVNTGYYSETSQGQVAVGLGEAQLLFRCPNWNLIPKVVCTNREASGVVRGFGGLELKSAFLPILTMAMEKADVDPFEFFRKNFVRPGDGFYWRESQWWTCNGVDYTKAMDKGAEMFGWKEKWKGWLKPTAVNAVKRRGVGVGVHGNADVGEDTAEAYVRLEPNGSATLYSAIQEHGTGQRSNLCKMVAEVLQLPLDRISVTPSDSSVNPFDFGPAGSRCTFTTGSAVIAAAEDARDQLFKRMAPLFNATPEDLETEDGMVFMKRKPQERLPWIAGLGFDRTILGRGSFEPNFSMPNMMMVFTEVEVDTETGKVDLIRVVGATDIGQIIDPPSLMNQLNGCLGAAGIDSALFEETVLDTRLGRILTANMIDYKWRSFSELPEMEHAILETPFQTHRFHAIGVGEITSAPGPSAVLMAVSNAIGLRIHDYPVTPDRVLRALGKTKGRTAEGSAGENKQGGAK